MARSTLPFRERLRRLLDLGWEVRRVEPYYQDARCDQCGRRSFGRTAYERPDGGMMTCSMRCAETHEAQRVRAAAQGSYHLRRQIRRKLRR